MELEEAAVAIGAHRNDAKEANHVDQLLGALRDDLPTGTSKMHIENVQCAFCCGRGRSANQHRLVDVALGDSAAPAAFLHQSMEFRK